jgi:predicted component of type VI protein secretion system
MAKLFVISGDDIGCTYEVTGDKLVLGRGKDADLVVRGGSVSRKHARLERVGVGWRLVDLGSSNGIRVSGMKVGEAELTDGETFQLGDIELRLRFEAAPPAQPTYEERAAETDFIPPATAEVHVSPAELQSDSDSSELELEGDWDDDAQLSAPVRSGPTPVPAPKPKPRPANAPASAPAPAAATAARRAQALGGAPAGGARSTTGGGRILQYNKVENRAGAFGADLGQQTTGTRWLLYALVVLLFGALVYGAYTLTSAARRNAALVQDERGS